MLTNYYADALKQGQKEFRRCTAEGIHPYPTALESILPEGERISGTDMGVIQIPMEHVAGTRTTARALSFSRSMLPLIPAGSEFADKWQRLCQAHVEEGIRDPIKVWEYMNRFYVEEGNKRVSVLRFFGADTVDAQVTRIMPTDRGDPETDLYFEYVEFYRASRVNYIEFTKPGGYARLQQLLGKSPGQVWTDDDRMSFRAAYYFFRSAYEANGGKRLTTTVGDAMLAYLEVFGYQQLRSTTASEIKRSMSKVWEEFALQQETEPIDVKLSPETEKPGLLSRVLPKSEKPLAVAFIHDKDPAFSGWTLGHELGREYVQRVFGDKIVTKAYFNAMDGDADQVIRQAADEGSTVIFTTSPRLLPASLRAAVENPKLTILNCALNMSHRYIRTYYARMYEPKFIAGVIAGALAGGEDVGYVCDYPIYGQVAGINAFALGVQSVSPQSEVRLEWSSVAGDGSAVQRLAGRGIRLISSQDLTRLTDRGRTPFGLGLVNPDGSQVNLAMPVWRWGVYYEALLRRIRDGSFQAESAGSPKALNYYWGMSAGVVEMRYSDKLPIGVRKMAGLLEKSICAGLCQPFTGPLYDQAGQVVLDKGKVLTPEQIIDMNWLNENVAGSIPTYSELTETGKATVWIAGVTGARPGTGEEAP